MQGARGKTVAAVPEVVEKKKEEVKRGNDDVKKKVGEKRVGKR